MNYVVVGGGGFIGSNLSEALLYNQNQVVVVDHPNALFLKKLYNLGATIITGDFGDEEIIKKALSQGEIIFHLASTTVPKTSNENLIFDIETNLIGTIKLVNIAKDIGVKKIIFSSSGGTVYGIPKEIPIKENHPTEPTCSYGIIKLTIEKYLHFFWTMYGLDYKILRMSNVFGKRQIPNKPQGIIPTLIYKGLHHEKINIWGDGTAIRDYIYISDVIDAFIKVEKDRSEDRIYNIGSGEGHSINEITTYIENYLQIPLDIINIPRIKTDVQVNILDNSLAKENLNWSPKINLINGIIQTINYLEHEYKYDLL